MLSFGCQLAIARMDERFAVTASGGHVPILHLAPVETMETDFVAVAERFLGIPYLWGGKTSLGMDCSGFRSSRSPPAASRVRATATCRSGHWAARWRARTARELRRGDLLFWKGHVAIVRDEATLVHANAHHMAVAVEATAPAIARIRAAGGEVTSVRRLPPPS